jgi:uncharacterized RDD family membrane protein YckC
LPWETAHLANNIPAPLWYDPNPAVWRSVAISIPSLLLLLYILYCFFTKWKTAIHDLAAGTGVIRVFWSG